MNYTSFIIKILNKPHYTLYEQKIPLTEALGKFYQFHNLIKKSSDLINLMKSPYEL